MILNGFLRNLFLEKRLMARKTPPPPLKANAIKNLHFVFGNPSLSLDPLLFVVFVFVIKDDINPPPGE